MFKEDLQTKIKEYAIDKGIVTIPEIQAEFKSSYKEVASIVHKLCEEKFLALSGNGLQYVVCNAQFHSGQRLRYGEYNDTNARRHFKSNANIGDLFDNDEISTDDKAEKNLRNIFFDTDIYKRMAEEYTAKILLFCIEEKEISLYSVAHEFNCGFVKANNILDRMLVKGYLVPVRRGDETAYITKYTKKRCLEEFGDKYPKLFNKKEGSEELLKKLYERLAHPFNMRVAKMHKSYTSLLTAKFDMQMAKSQVPDINKKAEDFISRAQNNLSVYDGEWNSSRTFEGICMDVIEKIAGMNKQWRRMDAVKEAAMELVALDYSKQNKKVLSIHSRVLHELLDGTDEDYELIKKKLWVDY